MQYTDTLSISFSTSVYPDLLSHVLKAACNNIFENCVACCCIGVDIYSGMGLLDYISPMPELLPLFMDAAVYIVADYPYHVSHLFQTGVKRMIKWLKVWI